MPPPQKSRVRIRSAGPSAPPTPPPVTRRAGTRVGLTKDQILDAAKRSIATRPGTVTVKAVAAALGVAHNSINSRFKRDGTTLERELAKEFLFSISRPMLPGEDWRSYLRNLFSDALRECETNPGLARAVTLWIGHDPTLCGEFTERVLHLLGSAGLSAQTAADTHDLVLAAVCGMLAVRFPDFGGNPDTWAKAVSQTMSAVDPRRLPLMHRSRDALAVAAGEKAAAGQHPNPRHPFAIEMADLIIRCVEAKLRADDDGGGK